MKYVKYILCGLLCILLLGGCAKKPETDFSQNSPLLIGTWRMTDYTPDNDDNIEWAKENIVWAEEDILFTYRADGTGEKTVKGEVEYTFTYSFDGKYLYTTAAYSDGHTNLMKDITTVSGDTVSIYSYDEKATIILVREQTAVTTTDTTTAVTTVVTTVKTTVATTNATKAPTTTKKPTTVASTTSSSKKVVQAANPETGISWDGKSPIVYTYADGSTGTNPQNGAKYEVEPGIYGVVFVEKAEYDGHCSSCGKVEGDGKNGTCVSWLMGDVDCPNCGEHVKANTCHSCK